MRAHSRRAVDGRLLGAAGAIIAGAICGATGVLGSQVAYAAPAANAIASSIAGFETASNEVSTVRKQLEKEQGEAAAPSKDSLSLGSRLEVTAGTAGLFAFSGSTRQLSLFAEARYRFSQSWQFGGSLAYRYQLSNEVSDSAFQALFGPTFNFGGGSDAYGGHAIHDSFFLSPKAGVTLGKTAFGEVTVRSSTAATFGLTAGKRFALSESVAYAPSVGVIKEMGSSPTFTIQPISLSVFF